MTSLVPISLKERTLPPLLTGAGAPIGTGRTSWGSLVPLMNRLVKSILGAFSWALSISLSLLAAQECWAGPVSQFLESPQGRFALARLGFEEIALRRILGDATLIARLEVEPQFAAFREGIQNFLEMASHERDLNRFSNWANFQSEVFRNSLFNALSEEGQAWRAASARHLMTQRPVSLGPGSVPGRLNLDPFWNQPQAVGLTYSFDSELPEGEVIRLLLSYERTRTLVTDLLSGLRMTQADLLSTLRLRSAAQLRHFALRRGARPIEVEGSASPLYSLNDLYPHALAQITASSSAMEHVLRQSGRHLSVFRRDLRQITQLLFAEQGLRVGAHLDGDVIELTHASFERSPGQFRSQIEILHSLVGLPSTHLHVGIPLSLRSIQDVNSIGQAIEAPMTLRMLLNTENGQGAFLTYLNGSTFSTPRFLATSQRGLVRTFPSRFVAPQAAHDLEIRQWSCIEEGMKSLSIASRLALDPRPLWHWAPSLSSIHLDGQAGDVRGALAYLVDLLGRSPNPERQEVALRLGDSLRQLSLPSSWVDSGQIVNDARKYVVHPVLRSQVAREIRELRVLEILDDLELYF